ncbi:GlxA family transcriptional regulator [Leucobacter sp. M11]|uniref:GlxA family transcriptional regulator n=1 Tax=Leucobacter sp. M11 TaxID=2993565 RepID=UPI002D7F9F68|nr:helix-turn-helix domain-containing protein [Leucobacter sp. M11]MEB4615844.1 helix-turn-helix domain-containing protein [Leucobacter sp. M11]
MFTVVVLALQETIPFDLATPIEVFSRVRLPGDRPGYRVVVAGSAPVVAAGPIRIGTDDGLEALDRADLIVVPGRTAPEEPTEPEVLAALRRAAGRGTRIASICVGAFSLAEAGLLDGLPATTHWQATAALARLAPAARVDPDALFVDAGQVLTSAGASAGLDLCLHLVQRDYGVAVAAEAARMAVTPLHRTGGQGQFILRNRPTAPTATLERVLGWLEEHAHRQLTLAEIAAAAGVSARTLNRRFAEETGMSPVRWLVGVRVRHAQELLETSDATVDRIAAQVGFPSPSNLRAKFTEIVGVTPGAYRRAFRRATG